MSELARGLGVLAEPPGPETPRLAAALDLPEAPEPWEYHAVFHEQLYPYSSVYLSDEGKIGGEARDRVAGFWRALGQTPPPEPDHLGALLGAYASLGDHLARADDAVARSAWERALAALLWEHLVSWLPLWLAALDRVGTPFYRAWGALLGAWLERECDRHDLPSEPPAALVAAASLPDEAEGGPGFVAALLSPARSGFIVTRADLRELAGAAGLGLRVAERDYALRALLSQDAVATLEGLAALASRPQSTFPGSPAVAPVAEIWRRRAAASAALLHRLAAAAAADQP